jgi:pimeloyl-ACP methyl ester carboxylesterase
MNPIHRIENINNLLVHYDWCDYTPPWNKQPPETCLLYHGYARNMSFWQSWVPLLSGSFKVLRLDQRGCGHTEKPPLDYVYTIDQLVNDAIDLLNHLDIEKVHWIGESSGGIIGLAMALKHPERLFSLTLCDTPFKRPAHIHSTYTLGEIDRAAAFEKYGVAKWCRETLAYRLDTNRASNELCEWYIEQMGLVPIHIANSLEKMIGSGDMWPELPKIKIPTLILGGRDSPIAQAPQMKAMQSQMPCAKLVSLEGYRHGVNLLAPQWCTSEFKQFILEQKNV